MATRLNLGTNTARALVVNDEPVVAIQADGTVYVAPEDVGILTVTEAGDTAYVSGTVDRNSVSIDIGPEGIFIAGVGQIANQHVAVIRVTISDTADVRVQAE